MVKQLTLKGQPVTANGGRLISPDGGYLLASVRGDPIETMSAIPVRDGDPKSGKSIVLYTVDSSWSRNNLVQWYPVG